MRQGDMGVGGIWKVSRHGRTERKKSDCAKAGLAYGARGLIADVSTFCDPPSRGVSVVYHKPHSRLNEREPGKIHKWQTQLVSRQFIKLHPQQFSQVAINANSYSMRGDGRTGFLPAFARFSFLLANDELMVHHSICAL